MKNRKFGRQMVVFSLAFSLKLNGFLLDVQKSLSPPVDKRSIRDDPN